MEVLDFYKEFGIKIWFNQQQTYLKTKESMGSIYMYSIVVIGRQLDFGQNPILTKHERLKRSSDDDYNE